MSQNISKYVQITPFLLLEYEFNKDLVTTPITTGTIAVDKYGISHYFNRTTSDLGITNNILGLNAVPTLSNRSEWYSSETDASFAGYFDSSVLTTTVAYPHDVAKLHIVAGYNFDDVAGFLLQIRAINSSSNMVDLTDFAYLKQSTILGSASVTKFSSNALFLGDKFYDKYVEIKVPSIQELGTLSFDASIEQSLKVNPGSDVYVTYSTVATVTNNVFSLADQIDVRLPVTSVADNFNCYISESTAGDFIEYYATWTDEIIGSYMGDIESGRIRLYTSNNPNDNFQEFTDIYGAGTAKWVVMHELQVYENLAGISGGSSILTQKYVFTQETNFSSVNYFRPVLTNADIDASFTVTYICRLMNRMDGTQIIRKAAFASTNPKKYGRYFTRLNMDNVIPYNVFNKVMTDAPNNQIIQGATRTKYIKQFYETNNIRLKEDNTVYQQGIGPLFIKDNDANYVFKFIKKVGDQDVNVDLSGAYNYGLLFNLDDGTNIDISPTFSQNMNTNLGSLEFSINRTQSSKLALQKKNQFSIVVKNDDGSHYTFYQGVYYNYSDFTKVMAYYASLQLPNIVDSRLTSK